MKENKTDVREKGNQCGKTKSGAECAIYHRCQRNFILLYCKFICKLISADILDQKVAA